MTTESAETTTIRLISLREVKYHLSRWECAMYAGGQVDVQLTSELSADPAAHTLTLCMQATYTTLRGQIVRHLLESAVEATYQINGEEAQFDQYETIADYDVVRLMLNITLGALRGMIAQRTNTTFLRHFPLPIYNLNALIDDIVLRSTKEPIPSLGTTLG